MNSPAIIVWPYADALLIGIRSGEPKSVEIVPTNKEPRKLKSPGFFVCNHLCARMGMEFSDQNKPYFGFIHVPRTGMGGIFTAEVCAAVIVNGFKKT